MQNVMPYDSLGDSLGVLENLFEDERPSEDGQKPQSAGQNHHFQLTIYQDLLR